MQTELDQVKAKYQELQKAFDTERTAWASDKKMLEDTIVDMSTSEKHSEQDKNTWEQELRTQEQRAKVLTIFYVTKGCIDCLLCQVAEERYSNELVAHAESMKTIEGLRKDLSTAQSATRDNSTAAETAQAKLAASESSWKQQKEALDKEITALNEKWVCHVPFRNITILTSRL